MIDLKTLSSALEQLESERGVQKEKVLEAIEDALAAAYKKEYGKRGQVIRAEFDRETGDVRFSQIKTVVTEDTVLMPDETKETDGEPTKSTEAEKQKNDNTENTPGTKEARGATDNEEETKVRYNPEQHLLLEEARKIKKDTQPGDEFIFPLEKRDDYGRIAAQTAKQVIIQRIREAERVSAIEEYEKKRGEIVSGIIQRIERGNIFVDLGRTTAILPRDEQIPGEYFRQGERVRAYLYDVLENPRDITLRLSRSHPRFLAKLLEIEVPEIVSGVVEIKAIAREPGSRSKIAVMSNDEHIDPVGSCVGQRGVRITAVMNEISGEKIDIIEWSEDTALFIERSISPARVESVTLNEGARAATIEVSPDQYSLAIGRGGQNARLAARLTGWKIDIRESTGRQELTADETGIIENDEKKEEKTDDPKPVTEEKKEESVQENK